MDIQTTLHRHAQWQQGEADGAKADLRGADLRGADLREANLSQANLREADLRGANLREANLRWANLRGADLRGANLRWANLYAANVTDTVLDPTCTPSGADHSFTRQGEYVIGYRTRQAGHIHQYHDGRIYAADWFSTCGETECHPGLYLWPTFEAARTFSPTAELIRVHTYPADVHKAGTKWRCRWFRVLGTVDA